jgi:hypothetical protein
VCEFKPQTKFQNPTITPSGRKVSVGESKKDREKREKNAVNLREFDHYSKNIFLYNMGKIFF